MRKLYFACILFASCRPAKFVEINSENLASHSGQYVFENDTLRIQYRFWDNKGRMEYDIYNKLPTPIFVDWKSSAYIENTKAHPYFRDETNVLSSSKSYRGMGPRGKSVIAIEKSKSVHQDRISIIPPRSLVTQKDYTLIHHFPDLPNTGSFNSSSSPLNFRNFLAISTSEKNDSSFMYFDHQFYVSKIIKSNSFACQRLKSEKAFYAQKVFREGLPKKERLMSE